MDNAELSCCTGIKPYLPTLGTYAGREEAGMSFDHDDAETTYISEK
jgi:hypothetical protein